MVPKEHTGQPPHAHQDGVEATPQGPPIYNNVLLMLQQLQDVIGAEGFWIK